MNNDEKFALAVDQRLGRISPIENEDCVRIIYAGSGLEVTMTKYDAETVWMWYSEKYNCTWKDMRNYDTLMLKAVVEDFMRGMGQEPGIE